jgi:hypothetical protein
MGRICSRHEKDEKSVQNFWSENLEGRDHLEEDLGTDRKTASEWILGKQGG